MKLPQIEYFEWVIRYFGKVKYNLALSGMDPPSDDLIEKITPKIPAWHKLPINFAGDEELLETLSKRYRMPTEGILTTSGTSKANYLAISALVEPGQTVLVETPNYEPLFRIPQLLGAEVEFIERTPNNKYDIDLDALNEMMTEKVSMIIITNLHNPSGEMLSKDALKGLCELAEEHKCYLLSDEVYREFITEDLPPSASELSERAISTNSLTKVYGLGNLRAGWIMADSSVIAKCIKLNNYTSVVTSQVTEKIANEALLNIDKLMAEVKSVLKKNREIVTKWLDEQDYLDLELPKFSPFCYPKFFKINVTELTEMLINYYETLIVPGKFFGTSEYARIGFGTSAEVLEAGLENIENAVKALMKPN
jgi:aspartate/methionine/tyrosine aminotransferase